MFVMTKKAVSNNGYDFYLISVIMMRTFHPPPNTIRVKGIREESKTKVYNAVRKVTRIKEIEDITSREIKTGERLLYLLQTIFLEVTSRLKCVLYYPDKWIQFKICFISLYLKSNAKLSHSSFPIFSI